MTIAAKNLVLAALGEEPLVDPAPEPWAMPSSSPIRSTTPIRGVGQVVLAVVGAYELLVVALWAGALTSEFRIRVLAAMLQVVGVVGTLSGLGIRKRPRQFKRSAQFDLDRSFFEPLLHHHGEDRLRRALAITIGMPQIVDTLQERIAEDERLSDGGILVEAEMRRAAIREESIARKRADEQLNDDLQILVSGLHDLVRAKGRTYFFLVLLFCGILAGLFPAELARCSLAEAWK